MELAENTTKIELIDLFWACQGFGVDFLDRDFCRLFIFERLHPAGARCPLCRRGLSKKKSARFWKGLSIRCDCGKTFTARTGTVLAGKGLSCRAVVLMLWLLFSGRTDAQTAEIVGCHRETVRLWRNLIK